MSNLSPEVKAIRKTGVGASEAAAIMGSDL